MSKIRNSLILLNCKNCSKFNPDSRICWKFMKTFLDQLICLVNELKMLASIIKLDIYEIIKVAKTKPFGFKAFYPGPGYGGHCIPLILFYYLGKLNNLILIQSLLNFLVRLILI